MGEDWDNRKQGKIAKRNCIPFKNSRLDLGIKNATNPSSDNIENKRDDDDDDDDDDDSDDDARSQASRF